MRVAEFNNAAVETLENRRMLAANVSVSGDVLTIKGDPAGQIVELFESNLGGERQVVVRFDANGNGSYSDPGDLYDASFRGINTVVARLGLGDDRLSITLADPFSNAGRTYDLRTGAGNDQVRFSSPIGNDIRSSSIAMTLDTAGGNDDVAISLNRLSASSFSANVTTGGGDDFLSLYAGEDVIGSTVQIVADLGDGNDTARQHINWEGFDLVGATSLWKTELHGRDGDDSLSVLGELGNASADVAGTLDLGLFGDAGNDQILFALDRLTLRGGTLRLRGNGFAGNDQLTLTGDIAGAGAIDAILRGNGAADVLTVNANSSFGSVLVDGGAGIDSATVTGTLQAQIVNVEA